MMDDRESWRVVDRSTLRELFGRLDRTQWNWSVGAVDAVAARLGWQLTENVPGRGATADAGWDLGAGQVRLAYHTDQVNRITMRLTDRVPAADRAGFLGDAFAGVVGVATDVLGEPTDRTNGATPEVRWRGPLQTIAVQNNQSAVTVIWAGNAWLDDWDDISGRSG